MMPCSAVKAELRVQDAGRRRVRTDVAGAGRREHLGNDTVSTQSIAQ
jgi:hypothetical protein